MMLVCDSCEGREDVKLTRVIGNTAGNSGSLHDQLAEVRHDFICVTADLCIRCRNRVTALVKEAVKPPTIRSSI